MKSRCEIDMLVCKDHNGKVVWLTKILKSATPRMFVVSSRDGGTEPDLLLAASHTLEMAPAPTH